MYKASKARRNESPLYEYMGKVKDIHKLENQADWEYTLTKQSQILIILPPSTRLIPVWIPSLWQMKVREVVNDFLTGLDEGWVPECVIVLPTVISVQNGNSYCLVGNLLEKTSKLCK